MKDKKIIVQAKRSHNFFVLDLAILKKTIRVNYIINMYSASKSLIYQLMAVRKQGQSTHLVSENKKIRIWYQLLRYANNSRVIRALALVDNINLQQTNYNQFKIFIDLEELEYDTSKENKSDNQNVNPAVETTLIFAL